MTIRSVLVYGLLFLVASGGAYLSWVQEPDAEKTEGVVLLSATPQQLASVSFTSSELDVTLERRSDERGDYVWASTTRRGGQDAAHAHPDDPHTAPAPEASPDEVKKASFKAGVTADQLFQDLAPFEVSRRLDVDEDELAQFGFDEPEGKLVVVTKDGKAHTFEVGDTGYGHRNIYLRDTRDGGIYVAKNSLVGPLERAETRLPEKRLFDFERADVEQATVTSGESSLELVQRNREDSSAARWTAPDSEEANESAQSWLDKVFRLRSSGYVAQAEVPNREPAFSVKLRPANSEPVVVTVFRGTGGTGEPAWYAQSDFTRGLVELNRSVATDVADDLGTLFSEP